MLVAIDHSRAPLDVARNRLIPQPSVGRGTPRFSRRRPPPAGTPPHTTHITRAMAADRTSATTRHCCRWLTDGYRVAATDLRSVCNAGPSGASGRRSVAIVRMSGASVHCPCLHDPGRPALWLRHVDPWTTDTRHSAASHHDASPGRTPVPPCHRCVAICRPTQEPDLRPTITMVHTTQCHGHTVRGHDPPVSGHRLPALDHGRSVLGNGLPVRGPCLRTSTNACCPWPSTGYQGPPQGTP